MWIRQAITRAIADQARTIRIPVHMIDVLSKLRNIQKRLQQEKRREPTTSEIADRCNFSLAELRYEYPEELAPRGLTPFAFLRQLAWKGAHRRYPDGIPEKVSQLIEHELKLIEEMHYEAYFLTVWDLVRFARRHPSPTRGCWPSRVRR